MRKATLEINATELALLDPGMGMHEASSVLAWFSCSSLNNILMFERFLFFLKDDNKSKNNLFIITEP